MIIHKFNKRSISRSIINVRVGDYLFLIYKIEQKPLLQLPQIPLEPHIISQQLHHGLILATPPTSTQIVTKLASPRISLPHLDKALPTPIPITQKLLLNLTIRLIVVMEFGKVNTEMVGVYHFLAELVRAEQQGGGDVAGWTGETAFLGGVGGGEHFHALVAGEPLLGFRLVLL